MVKKVSTSKKTLAYALFTLCLMASSLLFPPVRQLLGGRKQVALEGPPLQNGYSNDRSGLNEPPFDSGKGQMPHLSGEVTISMASGLIEAQFSLTNLPKLTDYSI